jgi:hypothetical protein
MDPYEKKHKQTARNRYCRATQVWGGSTCVRLSFWILPGFIPLLSASRLFSNLPALDSGHSIPEYIHADKSVLDFPRYTV